MKFSSIQKHLEKKFKKNIPKNEMDDDCQTWNDLLHEWHKRNKQDPWPEVISALESYEGHEADDIIQKIKMDKLSMCRH